MDGTQFLTVQQAAAHFGVTEKTIRRRIAEGKLNAEKVPTSQGYEWRITIEGDTPAQAAPEPQEAVSSPLDTPTVQVDSTDVQAPGQTHAQVETAEDIALLRALELADRLQQENAQLAHQNMQLAGQLGFVQSELQQAREQIRLLTVAKDEPEPSPEPDQAAVEEPADRPRSWWDRLFGR